MAQNNKFIKRISCTVIASLILCLSIPSFSIRSEASAVGIQLGSTDFLASLYTLLLTGKIVVDSSYNPLGTGRVSLDDMEEIYQWFDDLNAAVPGLGDEVRSMVVSGAINKEIVMSAEQRAQYLTWVSQNAGFPVGEIKKQMPIVHAGATTTIAVQWHRTGYTQTYSDTVTFYSTAESIFSETRGIVSSAISSPNQYFLGTQNTGTIHYTLNSALNDMFRSPIGIVTNTNINGQNPKSISIYLKDNGGGWSFTIDDILVSSTVQYGNIAWEQLKEIFTNYLLTGQAVVDEDLTTHTVASTSEVVSTTNTVDEDAEITGPTTITVADYDTLVDLIDALNANVISIDDALRALNLSTVDESATKEEKEKAITDLRDTVSVTQSATTTITVPRSATETVEESSSILSAIRHKEHVIANTIAQAMGKEPPYPDEPEEPDVGPNGDPYVHGWDFPSLTPGEGDPAGSGDPTPEDTSRAEDIIDGISAVSSISDDIFNSSKGFNMITTVGYSFVIFSAIIGAAHFFGALGSNHNDVKQQSLNWKKSDTWDSSKTNFNSKW